MVNALGELREKHMDAPMLKFHQKHITVIVETCEGTIGCREGSTRKRAKGTRRRNKRSNDVMRTNPTAETTL